MFTGIIDHTAKIQQVEHTADTMTLTVSSQFTDFTMGESIAIDGACLTVVEFVDKHFSCQLSSETLALTIAANYQQGSPINLERAICLGDRLGGHIVTGHVDQTATIATIQQQGEYTAMRFSKISPQYLGLLITKGSVTVNGISLTINQVTEDGFDVMIIPHTLQMTNLAQVAVGDSVNIEFDYVNKIIVRQLELKERAHV